MKRLLTLGAAGFCLLALNRPAYAYLDPGTGSIILQALLGGVAGALIAGRLYWSKIKAFFNGGQESQVEDKPTQPPGE